MGSFLCSSLGPDPARPLSLHETVPRTGHSSTDLALFFSSLHTRHRIADGLRCGFPAQKKMVLLFIVWMKFDATPRGQKVEQRHHRFTHSIRKEKDKIAHGRTNALQQAGNNNNTEQQQRKEARERIKEEGGKKGGRALRNIIIIIIIFHHCSSDPGTV